MARRYSSSLLRFSGCAVWWYVESSTSATELRAQVAEVAAMPRITELSIPPISSLSEESPRLFPADVVLLVDGLVRHSAATLTLLQLDDIRLGDEGAVAVARLVREAPRLRTLLLDHAEIGAAGFHALGGAIAQSSSLEELWLINMPAAGNSGASAIAVALTASTSLQLVSLSGCGIGDAGAVALAAALRGLPSDSQLDALYVSHNDIGDEGVAALVDAAPNSNRWLSPREDCSDTRRAVFLTALTRGTCISAAMEARVLALCFNEPR